MQGDDVCHVLFTSGTTGAPKGAMLTHEQVCRAYLIFSEVIGLREGDRYLIVLPFFHSFGLHAGILCCLMKGATIVPLQVFEPAATMRFIAEERITAFPGAPAIYQAMLNHPDVDAFDLSSLRLAILGAAAIPVELVEQMRGRLGLECVVAGFGITESSGIVTHVPLRRSSRGDRAHLRASPARARGAAGRRRRRRRAARRRPERSSSAATR